MVFTRKSKPAIERDEPLPQCEGPKLHCFGHRGERFDLVGLLSARNPGRHGHVFEAVLDSQHYALKVFNFYDVSEAAGLAGLDIPEQLIVEHMDPFYAECRAYGRLQEKKSNGKVAVRCHGFTDVSADRESEISEAFGIVDWYRPPEEYERRVTQRQPFRAIVKDLKREETSFTKVMVRRMKADLYKLREMLVFVRDVRKDNYLEGKLVDFSVSWTAPHLMLSTDIQSPETIYMDTASELYDFDDMIKDEGIITKVRAAPRRNGQQQEQLRRSKRLKASPPTQTHTPPHTKIARTRRRKHR